MSDETEIKAKMQNAYLVFGIFAFACLRYNFYRNQRSPDNVRGSNQRRAGGKRENNKQCRL